MNIEPRIFNEPRLRAMMERRGIDLLLLRGNVNSKYLSGFFHNGGDHDGTVGDRPFVVFYFLDPAKEAVMVVPGVDLHLAMTCSWIKDVRAYATAERYTDLDVPLYGDFFDAARAIFAERGVKGMAIGTEGDQLSGRLRQDAERLPRREHDRRREPRHGPRPHGQDGRGDPPHPQCHPMDDRGPRKLPRGHRTRGQRLGPLPGRRQGA